jgi:hypothetical protein
MYCSPIADPFATTALEFSGMLYFPLSFIDTRMPWGRSLIPVTRPTSMPR